MSSKEILKQVMVVLIIGCLLSLLAIVVHEFGHCIGAWLVGGICIGIYSFLHCPEGALACTYVCANSKLGYAITLIGGTFSTMLFMMLIRALAREKMSNKHVNPSLVYLITTSIGLSDLFSNWMLSTLIGFGDGHTFTTLLEIHPILIWVFTLPLLAYILIKTIIVLKNDLNGFN